MHVHGRFSLWQRRRVFRFPIKSLDRTDAPHPLWRLSEKMTVLYILGPLALGHREQQDLKVYQDRSAPDPSRWGHYLDEKELSVAIDYLRNADDGGEDARTLFYAAKEMPMIKWRSEHETPQQFIRGITSQPWWDGVAEVSHITDFLNSNWRIFYEDLQVLIHHGRLDNDAYGNYARNHVWSRAGLYSCAWGWHGDCLLAMSTCRTIQDSEVLFSHRFSKEICPDTYSERLHFLGLAPGGVAPFHSGSSSRINFLVALQGWEHTVITVNGEDRRFKQVGDVIAFQDSYSHRVVNHGDQSRYVFGLTILHPDCAAWWDREESRMRKDAHIIAFGSAH